MNKFFEDGARFIFAGFINIVLSLCFFQLLLFVIPANVSYTITWFVGVIFVSIVYPNTVFYGVKKMKKNSFLTSIVYVFSFCIGYSIILLLELYYPNNRFSIFIALAFTATINFLGMRKMLFR